MDDKSYEAGYRDGASSLIADIGVQFTEFAETTMDDLLGFFRQLTGDPGLTWPKAAGPDVWLVIAEDRHEEPPPAVPASDTVSAEPPNSEYEVTPAVP